MSKFKLLSEYEANTFAKMDKLVIMVLPSKELCMALPGEKLKKGSMPIDVHFEPATKQEFLTAISLANHKDDWYSMMLGEFFIKHIAKENL